MNTIQHRERKSSMLVKMKLGKSSENNQFLSQSLGHMDYALRDQALAMNSFYSFFSSLKRYNHGQLISNQKFLLGCFNDPRVDD